MRRTRSNFGEGSFSISSRNVAFEASSWSLLIARSSALAGVEVISTSVAGTDFTKS